MRSSDLSRLFTQSPEQGQLGFRTGLVVDWDSATGDNVIEVAGQQFEDLPILASGTLTIGAGDQVALLRFEGTYFILGTVTAAGTGIMAMASDYVEINQSTNSSTPTDLATVGPRVTVYIGGSRRCLVFLTAGIFVRADSGGYTFAVSGASDIPSTDVWGQAAFMNTDSTESQVGGSASATVLLTAADGLRSGLNTFTAKYWSSEGNDPIFTQRRISVLPF